MKIYVKRIVSIFLVLFIGASLLACSLYGDKVGSGEVGAAVDISWEKYDEIINHIKILDSSKERDRYLHMAEEMLMDEACIMPIGTVCSKALCKNDLKNIYLDKTCLMHFENIYSEDGKKVINIQVYGEPQSLDGGKCHFASEISYIINAYGTLVKYDEDGNLVNVFLDHYELSDDGLTWKLILKDNLKWSDGKILSAKDFEYTLKRNANTDTGGLLSFLLNPVEGYPNNLNVKAIDDKTLIVKTTNKCPYFLSLLTSATYAPLRQDIVEKSDDWYLTIPSISSGPYFIKEWKHKESMVYEKNPYYFDAENIKVDRINLMLSSSATSAYSAYYAGDIDFALSIPETADDEDIVKYKTMGMSYIKLNTKGKMFYGLSYEEAKKLRKAISYCIDREFIDEMSYGLREKSYVQVNDLFADSEGKSFFRNSSNYTYPYKNGYFEESLNIEKARELLKEIGYHFDSKGKIIEDLTFEMMADANDYYYVSIIQSDLAKIGINMKIRKKDEAFVDAGKYDAAFAAWYPDYDEPLAMLELYTSDNYNNDSFIGRPLPKKN